MGLLSFKGGIHPPHEKKHTERFAIENLEAPAVVMIPLRQHIGAPCEACVEKGETVKVGQMIGKPSSFVSSPVHSSVSGMVKEITLQPVLGGKELCVVIENDGAYTVHESVQPKGKLEDLSSADLMQIVKDAGIVGMGGAGFPTHVKLSPPPEKKIDTVILNGAECEPFLTADHRLMIETPERVVRGLEAIMKILGVTQGFIGIEDNKPDAIQAMKKAATGKNGISVVGLHTKYPQGAEKQLIYACTKRMVPSGGLPMETGVVVNNVATAAAVDDAIQTGMPLIERICTVTGPGVLAPKNVKIRMGTPLRSIIEFCGGLRPETDKVILGGPMMGMATNTIDIPATKTTSGILALMGSDAHLPEAGPCIKCSKCVSICPAFIEPLNVSAYSMKGMLEHAEKAHALDCIECGSCSFVCPAKRPLLPTIRLAKREILSSKRKAK